ncbi:MAG: DUF2314 domain-containing protein [Alphaproteobacteria bacterium]|nr:DUF2314 domain-containing protein [Alphaproteobacteria bacterium]
MKQILLAIAAFFTLATPALAQEPIPDRVVDYGTSDARMNGAIEQARTLLPIFLAELRSAPEQSRGAFTLKAALPTSNGGREHIWIGNLRQERGQLVGDLINEPYYLPGLSLGSRVEINEADISDWCIATPQGTYGAYTTRVMLEDMSPEEAALYRRQLNLASDPAPPGWTL